MVLSTSTNIVAFKPDGTKNTAKYCIEMCAQAGYKVLDINFCEAMNPNSRMRDDDWEVYVKELAAIGKSCGVIFTQSHLPYYDVFGKNEPAKIELLEELIRRSIIASGMLGVKWAVTHPATVYGTADSNVSLSKNVEYYTKHLNTAKQYGVGIALENEFEYIGPHRERMFASNAYELLALVNAFNDDNVGICYDFGHGNLAGGYHTENLNIFKDKLKAVHVQDNLGLRDDHMLPFCGNINWQEAMAGLADIDYKYELTYEIQEYARYHPNEIKHIALKTSIEVGNYLISLYEKALADKKAGFGK